MNAKSVFAFLCLAAAPFHGAQAANLVENGDLQQFTLKTDSVGVAYMGPTGWDIANYPRTVKTIAIVTTAAGESYGYLSTHAMPGGRNGLSAAYPVDPKMSQYVTVPEAGSYKLSVDVSHSVRVLQSGQGLAIAIDGVDQLKDLEPATAYADVPVHTATATVTISSPGRHLLYVHRLKSRTTLPVSSMTFDNIVLEKLP